MMEAMSMGCVLVASDTDPVKEVIEHEKNGLLVDFFSHEEIAKAVDRVLDHQDRMKHLGVSARKTILQHYALDKVLPLHMSLIKDLAKGKVPPPTAKKIAELNKS